MWLSLAQHFFHLKCQTSQVCMKEAAASRLVFVCWVAAVASGCAAGHRWKTGWMLHLLLKPQSFAKCRPQNSIRISWWWGTIHLFHTLSLLPQETALHPLPFATFSSQTVFFILEHNQDMSSGKMHLMVHPRVEESACLKVIFIPQEDLN